MSNYRYLSFACLLLSASFSNSPVYAVVSMDWAPIGQPNNPWDESTTETVYGSVDHTYAISKKMVTNAQWTEFLNSKDPTGANALALYSASMSTNVNGGITYNAGAADGSKYNVKSGQGNQPVGFISFYDSLRFVNWMQNGQGNGDTESGAYTLLGGTPTPSNANTITRSPNAVFGLPTENEFYKAAFYDPNKVGGPGYYDYATGSDAAPVSALPPGTPGVPAANYFSINTGFAVTGGGTPSFNPNGVFTGGVTDPTINYLTDVGAYTNSPSPYGTYDQSGLYWEWLDSPLKNLDGTPNPALHLLRGGVFNGKIDYTSAAYYSAAGNSGSGFYGIRLVGFFPGDANFDGIVNGQDIALAASDWLQTGTSVPGDLNGDSIVNGQDIALVASNWLSTYGLGATSSVAVPEPASIFLAVTAGVMLLTCARPRRRS